MQKRREGEDVFSTVDSSRALWVSLEAGRTSLAEANITKQSLSANPCARHYSFNT
jgi:hypothetical protein